MRACLPLQIQLACQTGFLRPDSPNSCTPAELREQHAGWQCPVVYTFVIHISLDYIFVGDAPPVDLHWNEAIASVSSGSTTPTKA